MINLDLLKDAFYDWASVVTSRTIVWQFENVPIPQGVYFSLRIDNIVQKGDAEYIEPETPVLPGDKDLVTRWEGMLHILGFGTNVMQDTLILKNSLNKNEIHQQLKDAGIITWNGENPVLDISGIDNSENEQRSSWDMNFRFCSVESNENVGEIVIVNADGTYKQTGKPDITTTLNIDAS